MSKICPIYKGGDAAITQALHQPFEQQIAVVLRDCRPHAPAREIAMCPFDKLRIAGNAANSGDQTDSAHNLGGARLPPLRAGNVSVSRCRRLDKDGPALAEGRDRRVCSAMRRLAGCGRREIEGERAAGGVINNGLR
jgi:hypothetical protein